jgi:hypothetical protein
MHRNLAGDDIGIQLVADPHIVDRQVLFCLEQLTASCLPSPANF